MEGMMNLRHYEIYKVLCEKNHMTKTAEALHMTQPAVSQVLRELESYYKVKLFDRLNRKLFITSEGEKLLTHVNRLLNDYHALESDMLYNHVTELKIGVTVTIGTYMIATWLKDFKSLYPNVKTKVFILNTEDLKKALLNAELDIGLSEGSMMHKDLRVHPFYKDQLVIIHASQNKNKIVYKLEDLNHQDFILREEGSGSRKLALQKLEEEQLQIEIMGSFNNNDAIVNSVVADLGYGIVSSLALKNQEVSVLTFQDFVMERDFSWVVHKDKSLDQALKQFTDLIQNKVEVLK